jgi:hypothetical protein
MYGLEDISVGLIVGYSQGKGKEYVCKPQRKEYLSPKRTTYTTAPRPNAKAQHRASISPSSPISDQRCIRKTTPTMRVGGLPNSDIPLWEAWAYIPDEPCHQQPQLTTTSWGLHLSYRLPDVILPISRLSSRSLIFYALMPWPKEELPCKCRLSVVSFHVSG